MNSITQYSPSRKSVTLTELWAEGGKSNAVFDPVTKAFLNKISRLLLSDKKFNRVPEIAALGFWLRKSNLDAMEEENSSWLQSSTYSVNPLGKVFHVAPSNVDTIFLYSLCISLLMGNSNVVRVSSAPLTEVVEFIIFCINKALSDPEFSVLNDYVRIITYSHEDSINTFLSANSNCRIIWGGNNTVLHFKNIQSSPYSKDILFPNRISYSIFKAAEFISADEKKKKAAAYDFFNDSYTFDQLGCSSPRLIFVMGSEKEKQLFADEFYKCLSDVALQRYGDRAGLVSSLKFNNLVNDVIGGKVTRVQHDNNAAYLVETENDSPKFESCYGGYFYIHRIDADDFAPLAKMAGETVQTLTWFGLNENELNALNKALYGKRIDRIVPVGEALNFHYIWDGMNLFEELSRKRFTGVNRNHINLQSGKAE